jgi:transcriptional regulator with XRE-family HTH domain
MIMHDNYNIGEKVIKLRKSRGLSQEQLALRADITPTYLGQIERNIKNPTVKIIENICNSLGVSLSEFFSDSTCYDCADDINLQIISQISDYSKEEKKMVLQIIKSLSKFRDL